MCMVCTDSLSIKEFRNSSKIISQLFPYSLASWCKNILHPKVLNNQIKIELDNLLSTWTNCLEDEMYGLQSSVQFFLDEMSIHLHMFGLIILY